MSFLQWLSIASLLIALCVFEWVVLSAGYSGIGVAISIIGVLGLILYVHRERRK